MAGWLAPRAWPPATKPNIVVIYADDLGYGDYTLPGEKVERAPPPTGSRPSPKASHATASASRKG